MSRNRFFALIGAACLALASHLAAAEDFAAPTGEVLLTVSGNIAKSNASDGTLMLDQTMLEALPQNSFSTSTTWTEGVSKFQGVLIKDLIEAVGATGKTITLTAANDYQITMPMSEVQEDAPLLSFLMNDKVMSLRDKGPVWMVYPYDADPKYRTEETYARSIWQLTQISFGE